MANKKMTIKSPQYNRMSSFKEIPGETNKIFLKINLYLLLNSLKTQIYSL